MGVRDRLPCLGASRRSAGEMAYSLRGWGKCHRAGAKEPIRGRFPGWRGLCLCKQTSEAHATARACLAPWRRSDREQVHVDCREASPRWLAGDESRRPRPALFVAAAREQPMSGPTRILAALLHRLRRGAQVLLASLAHARRSPKALCVVAFRRFAGGERVCVAGRVSEELAAAELLLDEQHKARLLERLRAAKRLLFSREVPEAQVDISFGGADGGPAPTRTACSSPAGGSGAPFSRHVASLRGTSGRGAAGLRSARARGGRGAGHTRHGAADRHQRHRRYGHLHGRRQQARHALALVCDRAASPHTLSRDRGPVPGTACRPGGTERNPILYVSRSPWSLYPTLEGLFQLHRIPGRPVLLLREWGVTYRNPIPRRAPEHKRDLIEEDASHVQP